MPPLIRASLERRDSGSRETFVVIFVLVIVFVTFICLFWGLILPTWQQRHPRRPSSTRFNGLGRWAAMYGTGPAAVMQQPSDRSQNDVNLPPRMFPAHPGVLARSDREPRRPQGAVLVYNPRTETPFPNSPPMTELISMPSITRLSTSTGNLRSTNGSQATFSKSPSRPALTKLRIREAGETAEMAEYQDWSGYGDAKEYIQAVPEPLALKPRGAGRPPPLTKQLERFPLPKSSSCGSGSELHPKKLFANLEQSTSKGSASDATETSNSQWARGDTLSDISSEIFPTSLKDKVGSDSRQQLRIVGKKSLEPAQGGKSAASSSHIHRAGTVTRPRTPVAEYRELFERAIFNANAQPFRSIGLKPDLGPSIEPLPASPDPFSTVRFASTSATLVRMPDKHLPLLPNPLRLNRDYATIPSLPAVEVLGDGISNTPSSTALPESPDKLAPLEKVIFSERPDRKSIGFYHRNGKSRPVVLSIKDSFRALSSRKPVSTQSKTDMANVLAAETDSNSLAVRMSVDQGSSRYSRDTMGVSVVRTPMSADFPTPVRSDFQILDYPKGLPRHKSLDLIRSKIDSWDLHTGDIHFTPTEDVPRLQHGRSYSDLGPKCSIIQSGIDTSKLERSSTSDTTETSSSLEPSTPRICVGSGDEDIFSDTNERPVMRGKERLRTEESAFSTWTTSNSNLSNVMGKLAPGNAEWI